MGREGPDNRTEKKVRDVMDSNLYNLLSAIKLSTARRLSLYNQWQPLLVAFGLTDIEAYLERARAHDRETLAVEMRWQQRESNGIFGPETVALDRTLDDAVVGVHDMALAQTRGRPPEHPSVQAAQRVLDRAFPLGLGAVVNAPYVQEAALVERIVGQLRGPLAADVATLHLGSMVDNLAEMAERYRQAVDTGNQRLTFAQVRAAQVRGLEYTAELFMSIMAAFRDGDDPDSLDARGKFLAAFSAHQQQARAARKGRPTEGEDALEGDEPLAGDEPAEDEGGEGGEDSGEEYDREPPEAQAGVAV